MGMKKCTPCGGTGRVDRHGNSDNMDVWDEDCDSCGGSGRVSSGAKKVGNSGPWPKVRCGHCDGSGSNPDRTELCPSCGGSGKSGGKA